MMQLQIKPEKKQAMGFFKPANRKDELKKQHEKLVDETGQEQLADDSVQRQNRMICCCGCVGCPIGPFVPD